jgi:hypothetical protein
MSYQLRNLAILDESPRAYKVRQDNGANRKPVVAWLPKSQCDYVKKHGQPDPDGTKRMDVTIPDWLGEEKGFIE